MDIIRTGQIISKTIRNVGRLKEIVVVFSRNGFEEFMSTKITSIIPNFVLPKSKLELKKELTTKNKKDWAKIIGYRLRKCFEELGPVFIKFGQLLSSREDMFDSSFIDEMKLLRDKVKGLPFDVVLKSIEKSLGKPINSTFKEINQEPIGNASIGVVYRGILLNGDEVVIKVRRPDIIKMVETDTSILMLLATQAEKISEDLKFLGPSRIVSDFAIGIQNELNFNIEALNCIKFKKNISEYDNENIYYIPKVYKEYSSEDMMVMELIKGIPFTDSAAISNKLEHIAEKIEKGTGILIKTFLKDGFFHADLHGGNFFLLDTGGIGLVDFGLMGNLSKKGRINFVAIIYSLLSSNYENMIYEFLDVASYEKIPDIDDLVTDVRNGLCPFVGLTIGQTNFSQVMHIIISTLSKHKIYLPREWFIIFKALITLDGVGKSIGLDLDIFSALEKDIGEIIKDSFNKDDLIEEGLWAGRGVLASMRILPRHIRWFLKEWSKKNYAFEIIHTGHENALEKVTNALLFLGYSIIAGVFIISGVISLGDTALLNLKSVPTISWIFWGIGFLLLMKGLRSFRR